MIFLSLAGAFTVQWLLFRKRPLYDPCWGIFIIYLYYAYFVPISMVLTGDYQILLVEQPIWVNEADLYLATIVNFFGFTGMMAGYWAVTRKHLPEEGTARLPLLEIFRHFPTIRVLVGAVVACAMLIIFFYQRELLSVLAGYESKIETNYQSSAFSFLMGIALLFLSINANYLSLLARNGLTIAVGAGLAFILISFLVFSKQPFIFAYLAAICYLSRNRRISPFFLTMGLSVFVVIALVYFVPVYASYRGTGVVDLSVAGGASSAVIASDAMGPFGVMIYAFNGYVRMDGHPLWQSFVLWIPRAIWSGRPLDLPEAFAREIIVGWQPGQGLAFSPLAEGYVRLGLAGVGAFMALCGALVAGMQRLATRFVTAEARIPVALTLGCTLALAMLRGTLSVVVTHGVQMIVPIAVVGFVTWVLTRSSARHGSERLLNVGSEHSVSS